MVSNEILKYMNVKIVRAAHFFSLCTKAKEGNNRKLMVSETWEEQKEYVRAKLSEEKTNSIYSRRKVDVEPVFRFLKVNIVT